MVTFPNAKLNIGLNITEKRADGFHNLETIFYPVPLSDILEFVENENSKSVNFVNSGIQIDGNPETNLCVKAYHLIKQDFDIPFIDIQLHKTIPFGAGLGGGSADAAFMLKALNEHFKLNLTVEALKNYASKLGSDCAFFIDNKPAFGSGKGDILEPIPLNLKGLYIAIVQPSVISNTKEAYSGIKPQKPLYSLKTLIERPIGEWKDLIKNDFETSIFSKYPQIELIKNKLYDQGAIYASMSGSGSSVFGFFHENPNLSKLFDNCFYWEGKLDIL